MNRYEKESCLQDSPPVAGRFSDITPLRHSGIPRSVFCVIGRTFLLHKKDLLLVAIILAIAAAGFFLNAYIRQKPVAWLEIKVNQQLVHTLDLNQDTELTIEHENGGFNHLVIRNQTAWIAEASCPGKDCVHQGKIELSGQMISCLPNKMIARVVAQED